MPAPFRPVLRPRALAGVVGAVSAAVAVVAIPSSGAGAAVVAHVTRGRVVTLAPGVTQYHEQFMTGDGFHQSGWITTVDLTRRGVGLGVVAGHNTVAGPGETVLSMAQRTRAVAGINGDLFDFGGSGAPVGGEIVDGRVLKSPVSTHVNQLALLSNHRAVVGPISWTGRLSRVGETGVEHALAVNSPGIARQGGVTVVVRSMGATELPRACVVATGGRLGGHYTVTKVATGVRHLDRLPLTSFALVGCREGGDWLLAHAPVGSRLLATTTASSAAYPHATVLGALQGAKLVLRHGKAYTDTSTRWHTAGHNPETFVCVARNHSSILLGTVDGRMYHAVGVTFPQLTAYMLRHGCYDGLVLDGGGSTTMVGSGRTSGPLSIRDLPAWGGRPRAVANGVFVYYRRS